MLEVKEKRMMSLTTMSYLFSKHGETYLELEASRRLVGVKPLCPAVSIYRNL